MALRRDIQTQNIRKGLKMATVYSRNMWHRSLRIGSLLYCYRLGIQIFFGLQIQVSICFISLFST